ncbi:YcaO-like family protein [Mesorhizobium sp. VK25A]|uniref:YcaO-like family protein n=1 Tax=Mesorhizobium vachelliae TaxID=3072309 RepID=A0ABU5A1E5_9HYPH|nr:MULTISPECIES: YcaO-like family protein [unclassified Mesorhizobium]MDX8529991.1 YcaO-like family protein [Mesorhizobium sp. VK25D]MDX8544389.1 YcaO-like family protein [Mesorhizobium sp. VK25A]
MSLANGAVPGIPDRADGAHSAIARIRPHWARMGITRVANVTGLDRIGIPVVMVCRPNARSLAVSQGKGIDLESATASGLMEAAELYHAEHIDRPLKLGSMAELSQSHRFAEIERLPRISATAFTKDLVTLWIEGREMISGETRWLPYESVRANFTVPPPPGSGFFDCSSNGLASGNTADEAIHHGVCEIVERDATALWNRMPSASRRRTGVDLGSASDGPCREVLKKLEGADFDVAAWETTSDVGVPAFFCLIADRRDRNSHYGIGAAAHPVPETALLKALIEAAQVRTTYVSAARDDLSAEEYSEDYRDKRRRQAERLLAERSSTRCLASAEGRAAQGIAGNVAWLVERLQAAGVSEIIAVDLSKEDIGLPVVRVVIPGLEGPDDHDAYMPGERARRMSDDGP